jgi:hypothetical protein
MAGLLRSVTPYNVTEKFSARKVSKPSLYCPERCERVTDE